MRIYRVVLMIYKTRQFKDDGPHLDSKTMISFLQKSYLNAEFQVVKFKIISLEILRMQSRTVCPLRNIFFTAHGKYVPSAVTAMSATFLDNDIHVPN